MIIEPKDAQYIKMTESPVGGLIASLAVPTMVSMLVSSIYSMADTWFVSKLGTSASAAVGIVFSLMAIIQAIGFMIGMGSGSMISRLLGARENDRANEVAASGFYFSFCLGLLLAIVGMRFLDPLMHLLGATRTILPFARQYAFYILFAAPVMTACFLLNNVLRSEGKAQQAMFGIVSGGVLNCFLDPLFIFTFKMGIGGAAIATALSQCVSFVILLSPFLRGKTVTRLKMASVARNPVVYLQILKNGLPSFCRQGLSSVATVALNVNAAVYGDAAVAGVSIVGRIFMTIFSITLGIGQGFQPVLGYNYGAKKFGRVREAIFFTLKSSSAAMLVCAVIGYCKAPDLMRLFIADDAAVISIGAVTLQAQSLAVPLIPMMVVCNMTFQGLGRSLTATILSMARQGIFFMPIILVFPRLFGLFGVQIAQALADICTFFLCLPVMYKFLKELDAEAANPGPGEA